jgi:hypothetical protein
MLFHYDTRYGFTTVWASVAKHQRSSVCYRTGNEAEIVKNSPGALRLNDSLSVQSINQSINQLNVFIKPFLHQHLSESAVQKTQPKTPKSKQCRCRTTVA